MIELRSPGGVGSKREHFHRTRRHRTVDQRRSALPLTLPSLIQVTRFGRSDLVPIGPPLPRISVGPVNTLPP